MGNAFAIVAISVVLLLFVLTAGTPFSLARFRWWRRLSGGHWELVDGAIAGFKGQRWVRTHFCRIQKWSPDKAKCLVRCEDWETR